MKLTLTILMIVATATMAAVTRGSAHYSDAADVSALISTSYSSNSFEVNIEYEAGVGYSYFVLFDSSSAGNGSANQAISAVLSCAIISKDTSWSSTYVIVGYLGNGTAWEISTSDARYILRHLNSQGGDWAVDYMYSHMIQIL